MSTPMVLFLDQDDSGGPLVRALPQSTWDARDPAKVGPLVKSAPGFPTLKALLVAIPDLPHRVETGRLANALAHFDGHTAFTDQASFDRAFAGLYGDSSRALEQGGFSAWRSDNLVYAPDPATLTKPALNGDTFVYVQFVEQHAIRTLQARRVEVQFADGGVTSEVEELPVGPRQDPKTVNAIQDAFGGPVDGYVSVSKNVPLLVAIGAGAGSAAFVVRKEGGFERFTSFTDLAAAHPAVRDPAFLVELANVLSRSLSEDSASAIADPEAYWKEYTEKGWNTVVETRYHQGRHPKTVYTHTPVPGKKVGPPSVDDNDVLHVMAANAGHQPLGLSVDLRKLTFETPVTLERLTTWEVTSREPDEGGPEHPSMPPSLREPGTPTPPTNQDRPLPKGVRAPTVPPVGLQDTLPDPP